MIDQQRKSDEQEEAIRRLSRAAVPFAGLGDYPDMLFDHSRPVVTDRLRANALAALSSLVSSLGERIIYEVEDLGKSLDLERSVQRLVGSRAIRRPDLAAALIHRAEEREVATRLSCLDDLVVDGSLGEQGDLLTSLQGHADPEVRRSALRYGRLQSLREGEDVRILPDELPHAVAENLCWDLAAVLSDGQDIRTVEAIVAATERILADREITRSPQHVLVTLMDRLLERGDLSATHLHRALLARDPLLACAATAVLAGVSIRTSWLLLMRADVETQAVLFTALNVPASFAARLIALLQFAGGSKAAMAEARNSAEVVLSKTEPDLASRALRWWRLRPDFRLSWAEAA